MHSNDNAEKLIFRMRVKGLQEDDADEDESVCMYLKNFLDQILNEMALKGIPEISKVTFS
jgi:hypothetical protein